METNLLIMTRSKNEKRSQLVKIEALVRCTDTTEQAYRRLVKLIFDKGERFPKRHGKWIRLRLKGNFFLEMDSWNKAVKIKQGKGEPKYYKGDFEGKKLFYFGMDFGGLNLPKSMKMGYYWIYTAMYT